MPDLAASGALAIDGGIDMAVLVGILMRCAIRARSRRPIGVVTSIQRLAAIRHLFDWLVTGQVMRTA
jgi:hypothetical protein